MTRDSKKCALSRAVVLPDVSVLRYGIYPTSTTYSFASGPTVFIASSRIRCLFIQEFEVPYIWVHKHDYISYVNAQDIRTRVGLLSLGELWRVFFYLGQKFHSLLEQKRVLETYYAGRDGEHGSTYAQRTFCGC